MTADEIAELRRKNYNATVVRLHSAHSDLWTIRVQPDFQLPRHQPGQYSSLGLGYWEPRVAGCQDEVLKAGMEGKLVRRAYSISSPILDDDGMLIDHPAHNWLEFYIVLVRDAEKGPPAFTPRLFTLKEGDRLFLTEKITGHFTLERVQPGDTVLFLSTGTGEAPHNYMLWELLHRGHQGRILAACCVRYKKDLAYLATHQQLLAMFPHYQYLSLTTREADTMHQKVYIQDLIQSGELEKQLGQGLDPARTHVFLCGNPKMIGVPEKDKDSGRRVYPKTLGVIEILEKMGFQADQPQAKIKGNVHYEEYW